MLGFLLVAVQMLYRQVLMCKALKGETVPDFMKNKLMTVLQKRKERMGCRLSGLGS
jgi:hypothetical protein